MQHFKIFLSPGKGCPLVTSVTLKLKLWRVEMGQVQILPKTSPVETQKTFETGIDITDMLIYNKNSTIIS